MDAITAAAMAVDNPLIHQIGMLLDSTLIYIVVVLVLLLIGESRNQKRLKVLLCLGIAFLSATAIKDAMTVARPCTGQSWCPTDYSFPSTHAVIAFALMTAFLDKKAFPLYLAFALFVCFTRMEIGVHTFRDIAGALPLALISYYITDILWNRLSPKLQHLALKLPGGAPIG